MVLSGSIWFASLKSAMLFVLLIKTSNFKASASLLGSVAPYVFSGSLTSLSTPSQLQGNNPIKVNPCCRYGKDEEKNLWDLQGLPSTTHSTKASGKQLNANSGTKQRATITPLLNIPGLPNQRVVPPDTVGDIGMSYYIQMTNASAGSAVQVFNMNDGSTAAGPFTLSALANPSDVCINGRGDPIVLYNQFADCWLLTEFSGTANALCVYVSSTSDPINGGWYSYIFRMPNFPDYPKYGIWNNAYYVGTNEANPSIYAMQHSQMLTGDTAKYFRNTLPCLSGFGFQVTVPIDADGDNLPPASPGIFVRNKDDESCSDAPDASQDFIEIFQYTVDFGADTDSVAGPIQIGVGEFDSDLCGLVSLLLLCSAARNHH